MRIKLVLDNSSDDQLRRIDDEIASTWREIDELLEPFRERYRSDLDDEEYEAFLAEKKEQNCD